MASVSVLGTLVGIFVEYFGRSHPPTLPVGWTATNAIDPDMILWVTSNSGTPDPGCRFAADAAFVNEPTVVSDKRLDSPSIAISSPAAQLTFRKQLQF